MTPPRAVPNAGPRRLTQAIVLVNLGLLTSLVFSPNLGHPSVLFSRVGLAILAIGLLLMLGAAVRRRRAAVASATPAHTRPAERFGSYHQPTKAP